MRTPRSRGPSPPATESGQTFGTLSSMSPEQARGEELDGRSDVFSFGVVLYEMATGREPFAGRTSALVFDAILNQPPRKPSAINPAIPAELEHIILKALEKDRDLRYQTAAELRADLKRLKRETDSEKIVDGAPAPAAAHAVRRRGSGPPWPPACWWSSRASRGCSHAPRPRRRSTRWRCCHSSVSARRATRSTCRTASPKA